MMGFNADDFLLVRNPAIKIIGKRNEREGGNTTSSTSSSHRPEVSAKSAVLTCTGAAAAPRNQDSNGSAVSWKEKEQQQLQHLKPATTALLTPAPAAIAVAASSPSTLPRPSPANEKPEPRLATATKSSCTSAAAAATVPGPALLQADTESSQLWSSKEEASSRLEALLKNTAHDSSASTDKNGQEQHDLKNHSGLCHLVRFEARRPKPPQQPLQPLTSRSRLPRPVGEGPPDQVVAERQPRKKSVKSVQHTTDDLTDLWSETHKNSFHEDPLGQEKAGKRYRSSIRIMVRPEAVQQLQKPVRANSSDGLSRSTSTSSEAARSAKKLSAAGVRAAPIMSELETTRPTTRPIVKEQFR